MTLSPDQRRDKFLDGIEEEVRLHIVKQGKACIAFIEKDSNGGIYQTWEPHRDNLPHYGKVMWKFTRKEPYHDHELDSALTVPIMGIVKKNYVEFYEGQQNEIADGIMRRLDENNLVLESFMGKITELVLNETSEQSVHHGTVHTVTQTTSHVVATTAGTAAAATVTNMLLQIIGLNIKTVVAKVIASTTLQHFIAIILKKAIYTAVVAAVLHFCGIHVWIFLGPVVVFFVWRRIQHFPAKLGAEVSLSVRTELKSKFQENNDTILQKIFNQVFDSKELVQAIADDGEFRVMLQELARGLSGTD